LENADAKPAAIAIDARAWLSRACLFTGLALACYGLAVYLSGAENVWLALQRIGSFAIAVGMAATAVSLLVRAGRWQLIFQRIGYRLPHSAQLRIYLSGLALSSSPGKVGETLRSLLLRPRGVAYADSLAAFVCDRLSDVVGIAALGAAMAALAGVRQPILEGIALFSLVGSLALAALLRSNRSSRWLAGRSRWVVAVAAPAAVWARLWCGGALATYTGTAALAYGIQGMIIAGFVGQVHAGLSWASCLAIFVNATLIGAASMIPGGLGTMDAALVFQLQSSGVPAGEALAAAIATRACTLWFAWVLGLGALLSFSRSS
jgi:uncharacterized membrane protein YbhN (UPF0104 family)